MTDQNTQTKPMAWQYKLLRLLHYKLYRTYSFFIKNKKIVALALIFFLGLCFYLGTWVKIAVRTEDFSDKNLSSFVEMGKLKNEYPFEDKLTLVINKGKPLNGSDFCKIKNWLQREVNNNPDILNSSSILNLRSPDFKEGKLFYPLMIESPCELPINFEKLKNHPLLTMFTTKEISDMVIHFEIKPSPVVFRHGIYDYKILDKIIESAKKKLPYEIIPGGTLFFESSVLAGIEYSKVINIIASILLFLGHYFFYRSLLGAFSLLGVILVTNIMIKAGMGIMGHMIDPLTSCIFLLITVSAIEDYILLSFLVFKQKMRFNLAVKKLLLPSFLTSLTTAIGFGSLAVSTNPSIVHFSIWTTSGAIFEWIVIFLVLPVLVNLFSSVKMGIENHPVPKRIVPEKLITYTLRKPITIVLTIIPFIIILIHNKANLSYNPFNMFDKSHAITHYRNHLQKSRHYEGEVSVVFNKLDEDISTIAEQIKKDPAVASIYTDLEMKKEIEAFPTFLQSIIFEDFKRTSLGKLFVSDKSKRIIANVKSYDTKDIPSVEKRLKAICQEKCDVKSEILVSKDYANGILKTLYDSALSGFFLIILLISWLVLTLSKRHFFPIIFSTLWASFMLLTFVVFLQIKINVVTCVALSVLIGLAGDNAIQFLLLQKESLSSSIKEVGEASSENFVLMILLSATLMFSYFETPRILSLLMVVGIVLMFIGDLWILNGLISILDKKNKN